MTRKASDAAIERVAERWNARSVMSWVQADYERNHVFTDTCDREQSLSDALRAYFGNDVPASLAGYVLPVVVDPIVEMVREAFAERALRNDYHTDAARYRDGSYDHAYDFEFTLSIARAIAAQGGGA